MSWSTMRLRTACLVAFCVPLRFLCASDDDFESAFFAPLSMQAIQGCFDGAYLVKPEDNIPYSEIWYFSDDEYGLRYFSRTHATSSKKVSIIEIYGHQFVLGEDSYDYYGRSYLGADLTWTSGEFWRFQFAERTFFCYVTSLHGANDPRFKYICLFDITDTNNVGFYLHLTYLFPSAPLMGDYRQDGTLDLAVSFRDKGTGHFKTVLYSVLRDRLELVKDSEGNEVFLIFDGDPKRLEPFRILSRYIP